MRRRLAVWLVGSVLLAATVALVGCAVTTTVAPVVVARHAPIPAGVACDAPNCHNQFKHKEPYTGPCQLCHNTTDWTQVTYTHKDPTFDHGMHPNLGCATCHTEGKPLPSPLCSACHTPPHKGPVNCKMCHTTYAWRLFQLLPADHLSLVGGHASLTCLDCHTAKVEPTTPRTCVNCHGVRHGGLTDCASCHTPISFSQTSFEHSTVFALTGAHAKLACSSCHSGITFIRAVSRGSSILKAFDVTWAHPVCSDCHSPQHGGLTNCSDCHTTATFETASFNHSAFFPLTGAHAELACSKCHSGIAFNHAVSSGGGVVKAFNFTHAQIPKPTCSDCHASQHGGLTNCGSCHTTSTFATAPLFKHSAFFPLTGAHAKLACSVCHVGSLFSHAVSTETTSILNTFDITTPLPVCSQCHSPQHGGLTTCSDCHSTATFATTPTFNHSTYFPLIGHHAVMYANGQCALCHTGGTNDFTGAPTVCEGCHLTDLPHVGPTDCGNCHTPLGWDNLSNFIHPGHPLPPFLPSLPLAHRWTDFGSYPSGCVGCHPGVDSTHPNFPSYSCSTCHAAP